MHFKQSHLKQTVSTLELKLIVSQSCVWSGTCVWTGEVIQYPAVSGLGSGITTVHKSVCMCVTRVMVAVDMCDKSDGSRHVWQESRSRQVRYLLCRSMCGGGVGSVELCHHYCKLLIHVSYMYATPFLHTCLKLHIWLAYLGHVMHMLRIG